MHSWRLYDGRYALSTLILIDKIPPQDRHLAERMLDGELDRQRRLKAAIAKDPELVLNLDEQHLFQNYNQLQRPRSPLMSPLWISFFQVCIAAGMMVPL